MVSGIPLCELVLLPPSYFGILSVMYTIVWINWSDLLKWRAKQKMDREFWSWKFPGLIIQISSASASQCLRPVTEKGTESRGLPCLQFSPKGTILPCLSFSLRSRATVHTWTSACDLFGLNFILLCFHLETEYFSRYSYSITGISLFQTQQKNLLPPWGGKWTELWVLMVFLTFLSPNLN